MDRQELYCDGEKSLLDQQVEPEAPLRTHRTPRRFLHAILLVLVLSAWWYFDSILNLFQSAPQRRPIREHVGTDMVDFADVLLPLPKSSEVPLTI